MTALPESTEDKIVLDKPVLSVGFEQRASRDVESDKGRGAVMNNSIHLYQSGVIQHNR